VVHKNMKQVGEVISLAGSRLVYRGEGNANLVVAIKDRGVVIRFPKSKFNEKCQESKLVGMATYLNKVMVPLLGNRFISPVTIVAISPQDLELVREAVRKHRPAERCGKDIFYPMGLLMPDLTHHHLLPADPRHVLHHPAAATNNRLGGGRTLTIEIKPKTGFLLADNCPHPRLCNFCLKQFYKLQQGLANAISDYCPLDLFSGSKPRMLKALKGLLACPQNNLRIFGDGEILHNKHSARNIRCREFVERVVGGEEALLEMLVTSLRSEYAPALCHDISLNNERYSRNSCRTCLKAITEACEKERNCDKEFTIDDDDEMKDDRSIYKCRDGHPPDALKIRTCFASERTTGSELKPGSVLHSILNIQQLNDITDHQALEILQGLLDEGRDAQDIQNLLISHNNDDPSMQERLVKLRNYIIYATVKDLSIFITFREAGKRVEESRPRLVVNNKAFYFSIKLIDLDPKHVHRISKYVSQKEAWLDACEQLSQPQPPKTEEKMLHQKKHVISV